MAVFTDFGSRFPCYLLFWRKNSVYDCFIVTEVHAFELRQHKELFDLCFIYKNIETIFIFSFA